MLATDAEVPDAPPDTASAPYCDPSDPDLIACYEFEGTTADASIHHLDASMTAVTFAPGKLGMALQHQATSAVDVAEAAALNPSALTIEAWIAPSALPAAGLRAGIVDNQSQWGFFLQDNGDLSCTMTAALRVTANIAPGRWTHVACTYDTVTVRVFEDGVLLGMANGNGPLSSSGTDGMSIAADNPPGAGSPLIGAIDELRLFGSRRSDADICKDALACP